MKVSEILTVLSILIGFGSLLIAYVTLSRKKAQESSCAGRESGATMSELGYIKAGIDDIKKEMR